MSTFKSMKFKALKSYFCPLRHKLFTANTTFGFNFTRILLTFHKFQVIISRCKLQSAASPHHLRTRRLESRLAGNSLPVRSVPERGLLWRGLSKNWTSARAKARHLASRPRLRHPRPMPPSPSPPVRGSSKGQGQSRCRMRQHPAVGTNCWLTCIGQTHWCQRIHPHRTLPLSPAKLITFLGGMWTGQSKWWWTNSPPTKLSHNNFSKKNCLKVCLCFN